MDAEQQTRKAQCDAHLEDLEWVYAVERWAERRLKERRARQAAVQRLVVEPAVTPPPPPPPRPVNRVEGLVAPHEIVMKILAVCEDYDMTWSQIGGPSRDPRYMRPRAEIYAYLVRERGWSTVSVGKLFRRDHSTVCHGLQKYGPVLS